MCLVCPLIAVAGGGIAGYFGLDRPDLRIVSTVVTGALTLVTTVALKFFLNISICDGLGNFSLRNIAQVSGISLVLGLIYTVAVNYILNRLIPLPVAQDENSPPSQCGQEQKPCCCQKKQL
ncbi:MAG: hypothetical protein JSR46_02035 [Verrucomicrobia bacterium]|nr:hypothetical protein [Verrucomicrobiota bacterium]